MVTVLIVDDEVSVRRYLRAAILAMGHQVVGEVGDGLVAIARTRDLQPQVVLLDLVMPGADGLTILPALRVAAPSAQVVLTTAVDPVRCGEHLHHDGVVGILTKPIDPSELHRLLTLIADQQAPPAAGSASPPR
jgi:DNA-binding NarL/FixJ family response regulator